MVRSLSRVLAIGLLAAVLLASLPPLGQVIVSAARILGAVDRTDDVDVCFWLHPTDHARSTVISSDRLAGTLFVYDLRGHVLQAIVSPDPGNVDVRYDFPLGGRRVDIVALDERGTNRIRVYVVDPATRLLTRVDDDRIITGKNHGFALYRSPGSGRTYAFTGPRAETIVEQWELVDNGAGQVTGLGPLRRLHPGGSCVAMVADDETGALYVSEETGGVWKYRAEPTAGAAGTRIAIAGAHGLVGDVEGLALYYRARGGGYLIASSQHRGEFKVYDRSSPHRYLGTFAVDGTENSDGCDVINLPLGTRFATGAFVCHNGASRPFTNQLVSWSDIASSLGLAVDTSYWDPRRAGRAPARLASALELGPERWSAVSRGRRVRRSARGPGGAWCR